MNRWPIGMLEGKKHKDRLALFAGDDGLTLAVAGHTVALDEVDDQEAGDLAGSGALLLFVDQPTGKVAAESASADDRRTRLLALTEKERLRNPQKFLKAAADRAGLTVYALKQLIYRKPKAADAIAAWLARSFALSRRKPRPSVDAPCRRMVRDRLRDTPPVSVPVTACSVTPKGVHTCRESSSGFLRCSLKRRCKSRSSHYADVKAGLFVPPVNLCLRARGTHDDEVDILGAATIADKSEVEIRALVVKLLLAELLRAPAVIEFDNLTGDLVAHKSLCAALTSKHVSGRILGVSKTATVNTRALLLSSGNNVGPVQDMTRRCLTIHLSPECEVPAARSFTRPELVRDVLRDRGRNVSAALTIVPGNAQPPADCLASGVRQDGGDGARRREAGVGFPRRAC